MEKLNSMRESINQYRLSGWAVFPVDPKTKEPELTSWRNLTPSPFSALDESKFDLEKGAFALKLNPEDLIIDIDPRNFPVDDSGERVNTWSKLKEDFCFDKLDKKTFVVKTGGGGYHVYLSKPADRVVRKKLKDYPGIDFIGGYEGKNFYVVGAGSFHISGRRYEVFREGIGSIKPAPIELLDMLFRDRASFTVATDVDFSDTEQDEARFIEFLAEHALPATQGRGGDGQTFKVACRGRDFNLSLNKTYELMLKHYNGRCDPPWEANAMLEKVQNAYKYNDDSPGKYDPQFAFNKITEDPEPMDPVLKDCLYGIDGKDIWDLGAGGSAAKTIRNAVKHIFKCREIKDHICFNAMSRNVEITGKLPWHSRRAGDNFWTDDDTTHLKLYLNAVSNREYGTATLGEAILILSTVKLYHPIRDYISHLRWDRAPRLSKWLPTYCGTSDSQYAEVIGRKTIIAAVARVFRPGVKFDHVLVLEGKQGIGKSMAVAVLGGEWFGDLFIDPKSKDTIDAMQGKWIIELSEMESTRRVRDIQALKAFITRTVDRTRPAYGRTTNNYPRQCIFIGTVNPDGVGYLTDNTGNRRFWPIFCSRIDLDGLMRDRDQLFAEAAYYYQRGEELFILDKTTRMRIDEETNQRIEQDPWQDVIAEWDAGAGKDISDVTTTYLYQHVLGGVVKNIATSEQIRIGRALLHLGWYRSKVHKGSIYRREVVVVKDGP